MNVYIWYINISKLKKYYTAAYIYLMHCKLPHWDILRYRDIETHRCTGIHQSHKQVLPHTHKHTYVLTNIHMTHNAFFRFPDECFLILAEHHGAVLYGLLQVSALAVRLLLKMIDLAYTYKYQTIRWILVFKKGFNTKYY